MRGSSLGVLLVEDDVDAAALVAGQLRYSSVAVHIDHVMELGQALARLSEDAARGGAAIDVVVLDLGLPDSPPEDPLHALREVLSLPDVPPVVVLTARGASLGREAVALGAQDYLEKVDLQHTGMLHRWLQYAVLRHDRERRITAQYRQVQRMNARLQHFAAALAHDLRSPLAKAVIGIETARHPRIGADPQIREEALDLAEKTLRSMGEQIDLVLEGVLSALADEVIEVDVASELASILDRLPQADRLDLQVEGDVPLPARRGAVQQMLQNLLGNALQHNPGRRVKVRVTTVVDGGEVQLVVEDDGRGIDPGERDHVLRLGQSFGEQSGTGLGLSTVVLAAHVLGGSVEVGDGEFGGARVVVSIPRVREPLPA